MVFVKGLCLILPDTPLLSGVQPSGRTLLGPVEGKREKKYFFEAYEKSLKLLFSSFFFWFDMYVKSRFRETNWIKFN